MDSEQKTLWIVMAIGLFALVLELVRRRRLREEFSVLWFLTCFVIGTLVLFPRSLAWLAGLLDIERPANMLFVCGIVFVIIIQIHQSVKVSGLIGQVENLTQEVALLEGTQESRTTTDPSSGNELAQPSYAGGSMGHRGPVET